MTNARDKANIPVLNFQSKGIDDNADVQGICNVVWTQEVKDAYDAFKLTQDNI